jgi:hypothetical protein
MISKIETIQHLRLEILRRKTLGNTQLEQIRNNFAELKQSLQPVNLIQNIFSNKAIVTTLLSSTAFFGLSMAARKALLRKTSGLFRSALDYIIPKLTSKIASEASETVFSKLKSAIISLKRNIAHHNRA